jgi:DNA-binding SARP family transcriptional activator
MRTPPQGDTRQVRVYVVGGITVEQDTAVLHERELPGNQGRVALAMLAVEHRHPLGRDEFADELWPDSLPRSWETALRAVISKVRSSLAAAGLGSDLITNAFGCYQLRMDRGWLDLNAAAEALHDAETQLSRGDPAGAAVNATVTCLIGSRPFLPGIYSPWTLRQRDRIRAMHVEARECLADALGRTGDFAMAGRAAESGLSLDPYRDSLYQQLIRSRALSGDRMGAAAVFARYRDLMIRELGVEPSPATVAVFRQSVGQAGQRDERNGLASRQPNPRH